MLDADELFFCTILLQFYSVRKLT